MVANSRVVVSTIAWGVVFLLSFLVNSIGNSNYFCNFAATNKISGY